MIIIFMLVWATFIVYFLTASYPSPEKVRIIYRVFNIWTAVSVALAFMFIYASIHQRQHTITETKVERLYSKGTTYHVGEKDKITFNEGKYKGKGTAGANVYVDIINDSYRITRVQKIKPSKVLYLMTGIPYNTAPKKPRVSYVINPKYMDVTRKDIDYKNDIRQMKAEYQKEPLDEHGDKIIIDPNLYK